MMSRLLITGATGFVGKYLVQYLSENNNYTVRVAVRSNAANLFAPHVQIHRIHGISAATDWGAALNSCNVVIHTAARVHVMQEHAVDPLSEFRCVNVEGTLNLARQAVKQGVKRFIYISSIKVNGETTSKNSPFRADDLPNPSDPYALSKYEAEQGLFALSQETGLEIIIIRPPLVYGPGVKGNFHRMIKFVASGIPLPFGKINNRRSFVSLGNLINLITLCINHPLAANQIFLVSDAEDLSTVQLLDKISHALGKSTRLLPMPYLLLNFVLVLLGKRPALQRLGGSLQVDINKTCELLDWKPVVQIDDVIQATVGHYLKETGHQT